jgi:hypothetical protein
LWVAEVDHLVEQLVDNDKVVSNRLLLELFEILDEDLGKPVEDEDDLGGIGISA